MKKHKKPLHPNKHILQTNLALTTVASLALAFVVSAISLPLPNNTAAGSGPLDPTNVRQVCSQISPATAAYDDCRDAADRIAAQQIAAVYANFQPPYKQLTNCREAVDYIFQDRVDYPRAVKVVFRESTNNPNARRPGSQYAGCAQLSNTLQRLFLKGPWNDPYFNVLALREAVDNPAWGWCHWDLVNYCNPGGEF